MGGGRAEALQRIAAVADIRGMEATEVADTVSVSARFITDNQGNMISDRLRHGQAHPSDNYPANAI